MDADTYQRLARRTLINRPDASYSDDQILLVWNALGLAGEAGELANLVKKAVFHQHGIDRDKLADEIGDILWYIAALCTNLDISLSDVMQANIEKLKQRYPDGYSSKASRTRA